jgi:lysine-arginine-ornithine-binding protein
VKKILTLTLAAAALAFASASASADSMKITIATEGAYAPFNFVADDGSLQGFDVDIAKAACEKLKADCTIVKQDWDGMIPALLAKKFDAIAASMSITEERKQKIDFSDKYYNTPAVIVARKDAPIKIGADGHIDPASMKGMKIGVQRATIHENFARANFPEAEVVVYDTADNANLDLMNGRIDARMDDILALESGVLKQDGGADYQIFGKGWTGGILGDGAGIGVRKEDTKLRDALSQAILDIRADGTYKKINDKYFNFDVYGEE